MNIKLFKIISWILIISLSLLCMSVFISGCSSTSSNPPKPPTSTAIVRSNTAAATPPAPRAIKASVLRHSPVPPAPVRTNTLITIGNPNITLILSNSLDLAHWTYLGLLTNGSFNLSMGGQPYGFIKAVVSAYPVVFTWTPSPDPAAGYELFWSPDGVGWLDYDLLANTNEVTEIIQFPNVTNYFTLATYGTLGDFSTDCNTTMVIVPRPVLRIH